MGKHETPKKCAITVATEHGPHPQSFRVINKDTNLAVDAELCDHHQLVPLRAVMLAGRPVTIRPARRIAGLIWRSRRGKGW